MYTSTTYRDTLSDMLGGSTPPFPLASGRSSSFAKIKGGGGNKRKQRE
jgi:hypothetical protein